MKTLIMGNSSSGKSTLAKKLVEDHGTPHLDLDTLAWLPDNPSERQELQQSALKIQQFADEHDSWVVEGCYADLLALLTSQADELIMMDLSVEQCMANAKNRPWEPHKYKSKAAQDANLTMLIDWIEQYTVRDDVCSRSAHLALFEKFAGSKRCHRENLNYSQLNTK